jgi:hypothetical protein
VSCKGEIICGVAAQIYIWNMRELVYFLIKLTNPTKIYQKCPDPIKNYTGRYREAYSINPCSLIPMLI